MIISFLQNFVLIAKTIKNRHKYYLEKMKLEIKSKKEDQDIK